MAKGEDGTDKIGDFIDGLIDGMVTGWVLFVYYIDAETGEASYFSEGPEGQGAVPTLGLLEAASAIERELLVRHYFADDDD